MNRSTLRGKPRPAAALLAAAITVTAFCAADAVARSYPFGPRTRAVNDLGNQYVPFHAHLWDLLHGRADGGLLVNWQSGFGSSFLPDLGTYLSSPFALLVALFPRDEIDLAVYVITVLKTASAGAAMAWLLLRLRPGRWWAAGLLGSAYALCGWSLADASYNPMWLDGLVALPLLCLVGEWALSGRRRLLGVLIVALAWIANFYTAYMATLGAGLLLLLRLWLSGLPRRRALAAAGRATATVALGVGLAAPLVTVVYFGTKHAYPGRVTHFAPVATEDVLARLLPTTYGFGSPALFVGTTALLLALALPFHRAAPVRVRAGWSLLVVAVALSMQWTPTHLAWHAFATPNGSPYRQTFVLCALLVIAAWHTLSYGVPARRALAAATALLALAAAVASRSGLVHSYAWPVLLLATAGALGGLLLLRHTEAPRSTAPAATRAGSLSGAGGGCEAAGSGSGAGEDLAGTGTASTVGTGAVAAGSGSAAGGGLVGGTGVAVSGSGSGSGSDPAAGGVPAAGVGVAVGGSDPGAGDGSAAGEGPAVTGSGAAAGTGAAAGAGGRRRGVLVGLAVVLLVGAQVGEAAATSAAATRLRLNHLDDYAPWGDRQRGQSEAVSEADGWPAYRTDPGREQTVGNDPMVVGGQGAQYYSSLTADVLSRTLTALGDGWTSRGRNVQSLDNAVTDAIFSVGARVHSPPDQHQRWNPRDSTPVTVSRQDVPPLVTVRPAPAPGARTGVSAFGPSPYRNQELLLGTRVYSVPALTVRTADGEQPERAAGDRAGTVIEVPRTKGSGAQGSRGRTAAASRPSIAAQCPAGSEVYLWAPHFSGTARLTDTPARPLTGRFTSDAAKIAAMQRLGTAPASGRVRIELSPTRTGTVPDGAVGCLDTARLRTAVQRLDETGADEVTVSDGTVRAQLPAGSTGTAVLAAPRIAGWRCAADGAETKPAATYYGLVAVPLDGSATSVTCTFHPPGLRLGAAVGGASLLTLVLLGTLTAVRRRRSARHPALRTAGTTATRPRERTTSAL
ncbi:YfhO family protein [Streptomyces sp. NA03103]|uniref:YfhO family protein n=1 Tax=Streptomyces sp. NA03103 TaxID=2742134 RepID=UPI0015911CDF|nr:YfhO family protein [Streptomyces sp. NA03103]QKW61494.1 YfhO family protein [Streptomyces sp. NA03103]